MKSKLKLKIKLIYTICKSGHALRNEINTFTHEINASTNEIKSLTNLINALTNVINISRSGNNDVSRQIIDLLNGTHGLPNEINTN